MRRPGAANRLRRVRISLSVLFLAVFLGGCQFDVVGFEVMKALGMFNTPNPSPNHEDFAGYNRCVNITGSRNQCAPGISRKLENTGRSRIGLETYYATDEVIKLLNCRAAGFDAVACKNALDCQTGRSAGTNCGSAEVAACAAAF